MAPLLPENGRRGEQWCDHRRIIDGILWRLRLGAPWRNIPECHVPWETCYDRRDPPGRIRRVKRHGRRPATPGAGAGEARFLWNDAPAASGPELSERLEAHQLAEANETEIAERRE